MDENMEKLQNMVDESRSIVFFGGAGVSTESGIPDFRGTGGLYRQQWRYPPETIISHSFFERDTAEFYRFYKEKMLILDAEPNAAHRTLAALEAAGKLSAIITQNIDGLHQRAGSKTVYELHGSILRNYCTRCNAFYTADYVRDAEGVPKCEKCGGVVKPDVVLYEEQLDDATVAGAISAIRRADMLIIGGTSLSVYPAAGLIGYCRGSRLVVINRTPTPADDEAALVISGSIGEILSSLRVSGT